ncbi:trypsin-like peptidase domain-containing protein [Streptomyces sp. NPDC047017]|uniref:trypsin-like serine peptidase n=1 Tax=Streptomyces sp. NPDC047017 TaxID=3155024 RepID=UPI0033FDF062
MKRTPGTQSPVHHGRPRTSARRQALFVGLMLVAVTSASVASADDGPGPLGVTAVTTVTPQSARIGALFDAEDARSLAGNHFCTASVVHSPHGDLILSAGHCLSDSTDLVFAPGYRDGRAPYGLWKVQRRFLPTGWTKEQDEDSDLGFAVVTPLGGKSIEDVVGANRFVAGAATGATSVTVTGYPDSREQPISCTNRPTAHSSTQQRIDCPEFTSGTSGSPWINRDHAVVGVLGGHEMGGSTPDTSYSVAFATTAAALYKDAAAEP